MVFLITAYVDCYNLCRVVLVASSLVSLAECSAVGRNPLVLLLGPSPGAWPRGQPLEPLLHALGCGLEKLGGIGNAWESLRGSVWIGHGDCAGLWVALSSLGCGHTLPGLCCGWRAAQGDFAHPGAVLRVLVALDGVGPAVRTEGVHTGVAQVRVAGVLVEELLLCCAQDPAVFFLCAGRWTMEEFEGCDLAGLVGGVGALQLGAVVDTGLESPSVIVSAAAQVAG